MLECRRKTLHNSSIYPHSPKPNNYREGQTAASDNLQDNEIAKSFARRRTDAHKNV